MSKKKRKKQLAQAAETAKGDVRASSSAVDSDPLATRGKKTIAAGAAVVVIGFLVLTRADSMGRNWAAALSPWLILGGYAVMGWGIFRDDPPPASQGPEGGKEPSSSPSPAPQPEKTI
ncbi:MAG: hypothetical protein KGL53_15120 [Elusimicrobia bacterium]|nr:hypothetical protein [Elusimicrobiota bacterium]